MAATLALERAAGAATLAPAPGVRLLSLGGRAALFCERAQALHELNATAERIWRGLAAGAPAQDVARALQDDGATSAEAEAFVAASAEAWLEVGFLAPADLADRLAGGGDAELHLHCEAAAVRLSFHTPPGDPLPLEAATVFRPFLAGPRAQATRLAVVAHAGRYLVAVDGAPRAWLPAERIVPELKAVLTERLTQSVGEGAFLLHAALLARRGEALLIAGPPGAGKTTLALALSARGLACAGDDIVRVAPDGALAGIPFSPASKSGAWPLLAAYAPEVQALRPHLRADGQWVRYVPATVAPPVERLAWALLLDRRSDAPAALEPVAGLEMLAELLASALSADRRLHGAALEAFARSLAHTACRRLVYSDLDDAVALIQDLTGA